ncbi:MAG: endoglucanase [Methanobrevibacter sp.]|nr:endoglucanase [Methanobrevibacter sp.]
MRNSNIIISVIIVLCIAAGVSAYGILNPDANIVNLQGFTSDGSNDLDTSGDGIGDDSTGDSTGVIGSSNPNSGSGSGGASNSGSSGVSMISSSQAKSIASSAIQQEGCSPGTPKKSGNTWIVPVLDENGTQVDGIQIAADGTIIGRG